MSAEVVQVPVTRWACNRGHFIAESDIGSEDYRDDSAYYGISSRVFGNCKVCGLVEEPHLVEIGTQEIELW